MRDNSGSNTESVGLFRVSRGQWLGAGLSFAILWAVALYLWHQSDAEMSALLSLHYRNLCVGAETLARVFSGYGMSAIALIYLGYLLTSFRNEKVARGRQIFLLIIFSFGLAAVTGDLLKELLQRPRPILEFAGEVIGAKSKDSPAFPSGHATKSAALVLPFLFHAGYRGGVHSLVKVVLSLLALLVCLSRIVLGRHYPSDVLAGVGWALLCLPAAVLATNVILRRMNSATLEAASKKWVFVYAGLVILLFMI